MYATSISGLNIMGSSFDEVLTPTTVFHGDNMVGKTARLNAIRVALYGSLPRLGVQPGANFKMSSDARRMASTITLSDGSSYAWMWNCAGDKVTRSGPAKPLVIPEILLDSSGFFNLKTSNKRIEFAFQNVATQAALSPDKLIADLKNIRLDPMTETAQAALSASVAEVDDSACNFRLSRSDDPEMTFQKWLDAEFDRVSELLTKEKANVDRMAKAVQASVQLGKAATRDLNGLESERRRLENELSQADQESARLTERLNVALRTAKRRTELNALLLAPFDPNVTAEFVAALTQQKEQCSVLAARLSAEIDALNKRIPELERTEKRWRAAGTEIADIDTRFAAMAGLQERRAALDAIVKEHKSEARTHAQTISLWQSNAAVAKTNLASLRSAHEKDVRRVDELLANKACPTCGCQGDNLDAAVRAHQASELERFTAAESEMSKTVSNCESLLKATAPLLTAAEARDKEVAGLAGELTTVTAEIARLTALKSRRDALASEIGSGVAVDPAGLKVSLGDLNNQLTEARLVSSDLASRLSTASRALVINQQRSNWQTELDGLKDSEPITEDAGLPARRVSLRSQIDTLGIEIKKAVAEKQQENAMKKAEAELVTASTRVTILKKIIETMKAFRSELVSTVFTSLMAGINRVVEPVCGRPLHYEDGDLFFRTASGRPSPGELWSGTEESVVQAGVCLAMAAQSPIKIVLFDELGRIKEARKAVLIRTVETLIRESLVDQFIGVDVDPRPYENLVGSEGFSLIHVT